MPVLLKNVPDAVLKLLTSDSGKKLFTEDILVNCPSPICLVGNSVIKHEFGNIIDSYATVIRMNNYKIDGYEKYVGSKTNLRCVTGWVDVENRNEFLEFSPFIISANESKNVLNYNQKNTVPVITARTDIHQFIEETPNPSAGLALIQLFINLGLQIDLFGFDGFKTNHYWEENTRINTTHSLRELDFISKREKVTLINQFYPYKEIYNHCHSNYQDYNENVGVMVFADIKKDLSGKNILEFGAGNGDLSEYLEKCGNTVTAIEVSQSGFEKIKCNSKINGDVFSLIGMNEKFDLIVAVDVLEHLCEQDIKLFLEHSSRLCKDCFFTVSTRPSGLLGPNGENLHVTVEDKDWWFNLISKYYDIKITEGKFSEQYYLEGKSKSINTIIQNNFFIKESYQSRETVQYFTDLTSEESGINYQPDIYPLAAKLARELDAKYIIDLGCGSGEKLAQLHPEFQIIGIDFGSNIESCKKNYNYGQWIEFDFESGLTIPIPQEILSQSVIINSDVIEHLKNPSILLRNIKMMLLHSKLAIISTPERELNWGKEHDGPPPNPTHIREWSMDEFAKILSSSELKIGCIGTTISNDKELEEKTILSIVLNKQLVKNMKVKELLLKYQKPKSVFYIMNLNGGYEKHRLQKISVKNYLSNGFQYNKSKIVNVIAIISTYNEGDVIYYVIRDLINNGIQVYLLDHNSTDDTVQEASKWLGRGLIHIERFPSESNYSEDNSDQYIWTNILKRKEELSLSLGADWYIHADADEFRESPWEDMNLQEAISYVDALGYNAIDFHLLQFRPTNNNFVKGDVREYLQYFEEGEDFNINQIKAWKNQNISVNLPKYGGHEVEFPNRQVFPIPFVLRHYPIRNEDHGYRKIFKERKPRFSEIERGNGWHIQYDSIENKNPQLLFNKDALEKYNPILFKEKLLAAYSKCLLEQLSIEKKNLETLTNKHNHILCKVEEFFIAIGTNGSIEHLGKEVLTTAGPFLPKMNELEIPKGKNIQKVENIKLKTLYELSDTHIKNQCFFDAYIVLQKILKEDPSYDPALKGQEYLNECIKKQIIEKAWNAKKSATSLVKAENLIAKQRLSEAKEKLFTILNLEPQHIEALNDYSVVNILDKKYEYASELIELILTLEPSNEVAIGNMNYLRTQITETVSPEQTSSESNSLMMTSGDNLKKQLERMGEEKLITSNKRSEPNGMICLNPFYEFEIDITGKVVVCCTAWLKHSLGNMKTHNIAEIWNSQAARYIRRKMYKGEWEDICNASCPTIVQYTKYGKVTTFEELYKNPHLTPKHVEEIIARKDYLESTPTTFKLSDSKICNLKCKMCSVIHSDELLDDNEMLERRSKDIVQYLDKAKTILLCGNGDPFARKDTRELLMNYKSTNPDLKFALVTNGLLLPKYWDKVKHQNYEMIDISMDAASKEVYEKIRIPGKWVDIIKTLELVKKNKNRFENIIISMVVMRSNYKEIPAFNDLAESYGFIPMYSRIHGMFDDENIFEMKDKVALDELRSIVTNEKRKKRNVSVHWQDIEEFIN